MTPPAAVGVKDVGSHRGRRLKQAVFTSLASKVSSIGLQLVAIPIAIRAVSPQQFASYSVMAGLLSFVWLCDLGLGPALTQRIAIAHAKGDVPAQSKLLASGLFVILAILGLCWTLGAALFQSSYVAPWLANRGISIPAVVVVGVIGSFQLASSPFLRAQAGYQELHIYNLFGVAGNSVAAVALIAAARFAPSPLSFLLAVYGTAALTQLVTAVAFLFRRRGLVRGLGSPSFALVSPLFVDGIRFAFPQVVVPIILREGPKLMLFRRGLLIETGKYGILVQIMTLASGLIVMFTQPLFPALTDAEARGDHDWIEATYRRSARAVGAFCCVFVLATFVAGPAALGIYTSGKFIFDRNTLLAFGVCSALIFWNHLGLIFFQASGRLGFFFKLSALELFLLAGMYLWKTPSGAMAAFAYVAAALAPTAIIWSLVSGRRTKTRGSVIADIPSAEAAL